MKLATSGLRCALVASLAAMCGCASLEPKRTIAARPVPAPAAVRTPAGPPSPQAQRESARTCERRGEIDKAKLLYASLLTRNPRDAEAHHRLAVMACNEKQFARAEEHFHAALEVVPYHPLVLSDFGYALYLQDRLPEAEGYLQRALKSDPKSAAARQNLDLVLRQPQRPAADEVLAGRIVTSRPQEEPTVSASVTRSAPVVANVSTRGRPAEGPPAFDLEEPKQQVPGFSMIPAARGTPSRFAIASMSEDLAVDRTDSDVVHTAAHAQAAGDVDQPAAPSTEGQSLPRLQLRYAETTRLKVSDDSAATEAAPPTKDASSTNEPSGTVWKLGEQSDVAGPFRVEQPGSEASAVEPPPVDAEPIPVEEQLPSSVFH